MSDQAAPAAGPLTVIKWVLDTRPLWREAQQTSDLTTVAERALALLAAQERDQVLQFYFVKDAKLALGSALLKRLAISRHGGGGVSWDEAGGWTRDARAKPVFRRPHDGCEPLLFNVSHQAGLVVLAAVTTARVDAVAVGVDVVCPGERRDRDRAALAADGWHAYVTMHADVFSPAEAARLDALPALLGPPDDDDDGLLAYFYTLWCLREAYVKMTGDALVAPWLRDLELRYFAPPGRAPPERRPLEIWFRGCLVDDVHMRLEPLLDGYVVCTALRCGPRHRAHLEAQLTRPASRLDLADILAEAEAARAPRSRPETGTPDGH